MNKLEKTGQLIFSIGVIALGFLCILFKDFIVGRPPAWPEGIIVNPALAYISGAVLAIAGIAMIIKKKAAEASLLVAVLIFLLSVLRCLPYATENWLNGLKCLFLFGGALIAAVSFYKSSNGASPSFMKNENTRKNLVTLGSILLAAFFIAGGYSHIKYSDFVRDFIPAYIPLHIFWVYFTAACLFAGGLGLIIPQTRRLAALLSGIMVLGWFLLLHVPRFIADTNNVSDTLGLCESFTFAGIFFMLAGMLKGKK